MSVPLLTTKFYILQPRANSVSRPRLTEKLLAGVNRPGTFILLSGPAGFGKTTLLGEFVAQFRQPVAWVSLDEGDNDPIRFWSYLIAACQSVRSGVGESALALLQSPQPLPDDAVPTILVNDIAGLDSDLVLVLDDYYAIQNRSIHATLSFLLDHIPDKLHIVLSTRVDPPWPLARFRARNLLIEVRAKDLRFTTKEATAFLNQVMGLNLSTDDVAALEGMQSLMVAAARQLASASAPALISLKAYVAKLLKAFPANQKAGAVSHPQAKTAGLVEALTARELEVLQLIAAGDSIRTIAEKLVITVSAVKKHTGNIFNKLNVNRRTQPVVRARELGLLSVDGRKLLAS